MNFNFLISNFKLISNELIAGSRSIVLSSKHLLSNGLFASSCYAISTGVRA